MKPLCHQVATSETVASFMEGLRNNGVFEATLPLTNPHATWPVEGDMLAIHVQETNVTLMAFVRSVQPAAREPGEKWPRIQITAGFKLKPFGTFTPKQLPSKPA